MISEEVGQIWQGGEELYQDGNHHDALLAYQRAKALLIMKSKESFDSNSS